MLREEYDRELVLEVIEAYKRMPETDEDSMIMS